MYGTSISLLMDTLLMAGTMAENGKSEGGKKDQSFPGESPTGPEFDEWKKTFENNLRGTGFSDVPSHGLVP